MRQPNVKVRRNQNYEARLGILISIWSGASPGTGRALSFFLLVVEDLTRAKLRFGSQLIHLEEEILIQGGGEEKVSHRNLRLRFLLESMKLGGVFVWCKIGVLHMGEIRPDRSVVSQFPLHVASFDSSWPR